METKEIKIQVPDGYEIDRDKSTFERIVFKEAKKELTLDTIERNLFIDKSNWYLRSDGIIDKIDGMGSNCNTQATTCNQLSSIISLNKLCNVAKYLNGSWLPNTIDVLYGHYIYINVATDTLEIDTLAAFNEGNVFFKTRELAQQAIEILGEEEIRKALTLNW